MNGNEDPQAPIATDHDCRRRAFQLIALLYGAAALANLYAWWPK